MFQSGLHILGPDEVSPHEAAAVAAPRRAPVLLVEDDVAIRNSLGEAFREDGVDVATAGNGLEALGLLRSGLRPSAIVLDLMMPVMDGWDFRHEQLRDPALKDIPVVVISATGFSAETIGRQLGGVDLVPKPVPYPQLLALLGRAGNVPVR
jgi:CheY-like chemotaxis protein